MQQMTVIEYTDLGRTKAAGLVKHNHLVVLVNKDLPKEMQDFYIREIIRDFKQKLKQC